MICYTSAPIIWSVRIYVVIIGNLENDSIKTMSNDQTFEDLIYSEKTKSYTWPMYILFLSYLIGRFSSYTLLYLRLKQMLDNSIFSYQKQTYNKLLFMLTATCILGFLSIGAVQAHQIIYYSLLILWIISDIIYFASVTFMYLFKLREIKNTYEKSVSQTQMSATSTTSTQSDIDCTPDDLEARTNPQEISTCSTDRYDNNEKAALELTNIVSIYTTLSIVILVSSFLIYALITVGMILLPSKLFLIFGDLFDSIINLFCSVLYFQNERNFYKKLFTLQLCCVNDRRI